MANLWCPDFRAWNIHKHGIRRSRSLINRTAGAPLIRAPFILTHLLSSVPLLGMYPCSLYNHSCLSAEGSGSQYSEAPPQNQEPDRFRTVRVSISRVWLSCDNWSLPNQVPPRGFHGRKLGPPDQPR